MRLAQGRGGATGNLRGTGIRPSRNPMRRLPVVTALATFVLAAVGIGSGLASVLPIGPVGNARPTVLSAAQGSSNGLTCPSGPSGLDNIPVNFDWFVRARSVQASDFRIALEDGSVVQPVCAILMPPDEPNERQTIDLMGDFGEPVAGKAALQVRFVGALQGHPIGQARWRAIVGLRPFPVTPLAAPPFIADAWVLTPALYAGDRNRCRVGRTFVRVVWSNGVTASTPGIAPGQPGNIVEVGPTAAASYRAVYRLPSGKTIAVRPLGLGDLLDHPKPGAPAAADDNMHDLCLPPVPARARLIGVDVGPGIVEDPNGDPNVAQDFRLP